MSSILKALKKVEQESAARKGETIGNSNVTRRDLSPPHRSFLKSPLTILSLLVIGAAGGYLIQAHFNKPAPRAVDISATAATQANQSNPANPVSFANRTTSSLPKNNITTTSNTAASPVIQPAISSIKAPLKTPTAPASKPPVVLKQVPPQNKDYSRISARQISQPKQETSVTVNGLALSDGEKRQAVVNGITVSKGSYVGGARVEEILPHRVRFSKGGKTFEVSVGDSWP